MSDRPRRLTAQSQVDTLFVRGNLLDFREPVADFLDMWFGLSGEYRVDRVESVEQTFDAVEEPPPRILDLFVQIRSAGPCRSASFP